MKHFIAKLTIITDGYEHTVHRLATAENKPDAIRSVLINECHGSLEEGNVEIGVNRASDLDDAFIYQLERIQPLTDSQYKTLSEFILF